MKAQNIDAAISFSVPSILHVLSIDTINIISCMADSFFLFLFLRGESVIIYGALE